MPDLLSEQYTALDMFQAGKDTLLDGLNGFEYNDGYRSIHQILNDSRK